MPTSASRNLCRIVWHSPSSWNSWSVGFILWYVVFFGMFPRIDIVCIGVCYIGIMNNSRVFIFIVLSSLTHSLCYAYERVCVCVCLRIYKSANIYVCARVWVWAAMCAYAEVSTHPCQQGAPAQSCDTRWMIMIRKISPVLPLYKKRKETIFPSHISAGDLAKLLTSQNWRSVLENFLKTSFGRFRLCLKLLEAIYIYISLYFPSQGEIKRFLLYSCFGIFSKMRDKRNYENSMIKERRFLALSL